LPFLRIEILLVDRSNNLRNAAVEPPLLLRADNAAHALARTRNADMPLASLSIRGTFTTRDQIIAEVFMPVTLVWVSRPDAITRALPQFPSR
jgi:hypothetical protein